MRRLDLDPNRMVELVRSGRHRRQLDRHDLEHRREDPVAADPDEAVTEDDVSDVARPGIGHEIGVDGDGRRCRANRCDDLDNHSHPRSSFIDSANLRIGSI